MTDLRAPGAAERPSSGQDASSGTTTTADDAMQVIRRRRLVTEPLGHVEPLDGLRAVAVMGVVLYHARFTWIPGGFLGVSTFFTLSGFLITSLLLREWNSSDEGVDLRRFWRRRFRRLLPASWMTIGAVLLMALVGIWNTDQLRSLRGDVPFALAEIINWHFIAQDRSYGADFLAPSPLEHFWSLAVEQQFYVILPLLVVGVLALGRRRPARQRIGALAAVFVALAAFSAISNGWYARTSIDRAYFGTDTRMAEMLVGSLLAIATLRRLRLPPSLARRVSIALGLTAIVVTGWLWHNATLDAAWLYPWGLLLSAGCTAAIVFAAIQGGGLGRVLSLPPLLWLGRISYGVYLLHWPVFLWLTPARVGWSDWPLFALRMAVTCALAVAMFRLIENPVRHGQRLKGRRAPLTALLAAFALLAATAWVTRDLPPPSALVTATQEQAATPTTLPPPPVRVAVVGDQVAASLGETISGVDGLDVTVSTAPDCGLTVGGFITTSDGRVERDVDRCGDVPRQWVETVQQSRPDVVLVVGTMRDAAARRLDVNNPWTGPQDPQVAEFLRSDIAVLTDDLAAGGAEVVLVTVPRVRNAVSPVPIPDPAPDPSAAEESLLQIERQQVRDGNPGPGFRENEVARVDQVNGILSSVATERGLRLLDLSALTRTWSGGEFNAELRTDGVGFTEEGGSAIGEWLLPQLRERRTVVAAAAPPPVIAPDTPLPPAPPAQARRTVGAGQRADVLVVGDSVAFTVGFALEDWGADNGEARVTTSAQFGCAVARGGSYRFQRDLRIFEERCDWANGAGETAGYPELVASFRPDLVVLSSGIWEIVDRRLVDDDRYRHVGAPDIDRYILGEFLSAIDTLGADGAHVVVLTQPHIESGLDKGYKDLAESDPARIDRLNELLRQAVDLRPGVATLVDLQGWVAGQPGGEMDPAKRPDGIHFSDEYAPNVADWLGPELLRIARGG